MPLAPPSQIRLDLLLAHGHSCRALAYGRCLGSPSRNRAVRHINDSWHMAARQSLVLDRGRRRSCNGSAMRNVWKPCANPAACCMERRTDLVPHEIGVGSGPSSTAKGAHTAYSHLTSRSTLEQGQNMYCLGSNLKQFKPTGHDEAPVGAGICPGPVRGTDNLANPLRGGQR